MVSDDHVCVTVGFAYLSEVFVLPLNMSEIYWQLKENFRRAPPKSELSCGFSEAATADMPLDVRKTTYNTDRPQCDGTFQLAM